MIRVNEDYIIEVDAKNYSAKRDMHHIIKTQNIKNGEITEIPHYKTIGHFRDITGAIKAIVEDSKKRRLSKGVVSMEEAISIIREENHKFNLLLHNSINNYEK